MLPPIVGFWGKAKSSAETGELVAWHPLEDHCVDVAVTFRALLELPGIKRSLVAAARSSLTSIQLDRLAVIALLHDVGKSNRGFQGKLEKGAARVGHVREFAGLLALDEPAGKAMRYDTLASWCEGGDETAAHLLFAAISHHGTPLSVSAIERDDLARRSLTWWQARDAQDPLDGVRILLQAATCAFPQAFNGKGPLLPAIPGLQHRFAGLVMLADWIASDTNHFPYRQSAAEDRIALARKLAANALTAIGLRNDKARPDIARRAPGFAEIFGRPPYPFQHILAETLQADEESRLVIAESDTGSGKTEAALAWFLRLFREGAVDGLYFALPTRVAARELYARVEKAIHAAFPVEAASLGPVLLAVPGYARTDQDRLLPPAEGNQWPDDPKDMLRDRAWVAENPKRFLAAPVAVGTIDQALLSVLQVRHAHLRSICLDRHLLVVDEVHASDPYMREILRALLAHHLHVGGWVLLLSATLGEAARAQFLGQPPMGLADAQAVPFPAVTTLARTIPCPRADAREKAVRVEFVEELENLSAVVRQLADALDAGARVLAVMNTVGRATVLLRAAEESGRIPPERLFTVADVRCPHHGRFARADREILDAAVTARFGPDSPAGPVLLVGTQTLEQSLDIDADLLVTDHCPMDVLLQRIGRLHRHTRARPEAYGKARCIVLSPAGNNFEQFVRTKGRYRGEGSGPAGIGTVYADLRVMKLTRQVLENTPDITIPHDNRRLVEMATHPEALATLAAEPWLLHEQHLTAEILAQRRQAELGVIEEKHFGEFHFHELGERLSTRLGLSDRLAQLPYPVTTPFGQTITQLAIPGHLAPEGDTVDAADLELAADGFRFALGNKRYRYTRFGLELLRDE